MRPAALLLAALLVASPAAANPVARHDHPRFSLTAPDRFERVAVDDARADLLDVFRRPGDLPGEAPMVLQVLHLDAVLPQGLREGVVLLLGAAHPRDPVEEQLVVVPRGQPGQLGAGAVQQDGPEPADLARDTHDGEPRSTLRW